MKKTLRYLPTLIVVVLGVVYIYFNADKFTPLLALRPADVLPIVGVLFLFFLVTGYTFYLLVSLVSVRLSLVELVGLTFLTNFGNYLGPTRPGAAIKAIYLKGHRGLPYATFSAVLAANSFLIFFISGLTGLVLLAALWLQTGVLSMLLVAICAALLGLAGLPLVFRFRPIPRQGRFWSIVNSALVGFEQIKSQRGKLLAVCGSVLLQYVVSAWLMVVTYRALGQEISITTALIIGVFTSIANFFTITPNNLGVQEVVMAYLYTITGMDFNSGLLGASLIRAVHILLTFGLTPIFTYFMLRAANLSLVAILPGRKGKV